MIRREDGTVEAPLFGRLPDGGLVRGAVIYAPSSAGRELDGFEGRWQVVSVSTFPHDVEPIDQATYDAGVAAALAAADHAIETSKREAAEAAAADFAALLAAGIPPTTARRLLGPAAALLED